MSSDQKPEAQAQEKIDPVVMAAKTMSGDIRDFILDRMKHDHSVIPWNQRKEKEQKETIASVEMAVERTVKRAIEIIASGGQQVLRGTLVKVLVKDGLKTQIDMMQSDPLRHKLIDHQGGTVLVSIANAEDFEGQRNKVKVTPDQTEILDDESDPETGEIV